LTIKRTKTLITPEEKIKAIEEQALSLGWVKNQLWATGRTDYRVMTPYEFFLRHGGEIYSVDADKICIHTRDDMYVFFYRAKEASPNKRGIPL